MTDSKRARLEKIRDQSNLKAKKDRLRNIIIKKMTTVFGMKHIAVIESFVDEFVANSAGRQITSAGLGALEKELAEIVHFRKPRIERPEPVADPATNEPTEDASASHLKLPNGVAWKAINAYKAALVERQEKEEKQQDYQKKSRLRRELEVQMAAAKAVSAVERRQDEEYASHVQTDLERFRIEENQKQRAIQQRAEIERKFREEQIAEQAARRRNEAEALRKDEQQRIERIQGEIDAEKRMLENKRAMQVERQRQVILENEALRLHRIQQKRLAVEEDQRLMAEYAAKMDREAEEREQAFAKRMEALEAYATKFSNEGAGKVQKEEILREERQLLAEQERKEKADAAEELRRRKLQKSRLEEAQKANIEMIRQKAAKAEEDRRTDEKIAQMTSAEVARFKKQEAERLRREAAGRIRFKNVLDKQLREREELQRLSEMSEVEKVMNKTTLDAIENSDKEIREAVRRKLRI